MDRWAKEEEWLARGSASAEANASASGSGSASAEGQGQGEGRDGRREGQRDDEEGGYGEVEGARTSQDSSPEGEGEGEGGDEGSLEAEVSSLPRLRENVDVPFGLFSCPPRSGRRFKGVRRRKWGRCVCEIRDAIGKRIWLGSYDTEEEAARVYDAAARILQGESAWLNFPKEDPVSLPRGVVRTLIKHRGHLTDRLRGDAFPPSSTPRGTTAGSTSPPSREGPPRMHQGSLDQAGAGAGVVAGAGAGVAAGAGLQVQIGAGPASGGIQDEGPSSLRALHSSQGQASQVGAAGAGAGDVGAPGDSQEGKIDWHMFLEALDDDLAALGDTLGAPRAVKREPASSLGQSPEPAQVHRTQPRPQQRHQELGQQQAAAAEGAAASFQDATMMPAGSELTDFQRASDLASLTAANARLFQRGTAAQVGGPAVHRQQAPLAPLLPSTASSASHSSLPALPSLTHSSLLSQATLTQSPLLTHSSLTSSPLMAQQPLTQPSQPSLTHAPSSHSPFTQSPITQTPLTLPGAESLTSRDSALPFGASEAPSLAPTHPLQAFLRQIASPLPSPSRSSAPAPAPAPAPVPAPAVFPAQYPGPMPPPGPGPVVFPRGAPGREPQAGPDPGEVRALFSLLRSLEASAFRSLAATPSLPPPHALQSPAYLGAAGEPQVGEDHSMQEAEHPSPQAPQEVPRPLRAPQAVDQVEEELAQIELALAVLSGRRPPLPSAPHSLVSAQGARAAVSDGPGLPLPLPLPQQLQRGAVHADGPQGMRPGQAQVCPLGEAVGSAILYPNQPPPASMRQGSLAPGLAPRASLPLPPGSEVEAEWHVLAKRLSLPERGGQRALLSATWPPLAGCRLPSNSQP